MLKKITEKITKKFVETAKKSAKKEIDKTIEEKIPIIVTIAATGIAIFELFNRSKQSSKSNVINYFYVNTVKIYTSQK